MAIVTTPIEIEEEIFTGTIPAADGPGIDYVLTLGAATDGIDTVYTLDMTYLDANGPGKHQTYQSTGKQKTMHKMVNNQPKKGVKLTPDNGDTPMYFLVVNDTTLRIVLFPKIGEIIGGSEREADYGKLRARIEELGMNEKDVWWYLDTRRWGSAPHSGFGLGFERLLLFVTGMANIRDVIPFPRTPKNAEF